MTLDSCLAIFRLVCFYHIAGRALSFVSAKWLPSADPSLTALAVRGLACIAAVLLNHGWEMRGYHRARKEVEKGEGHLPPRYPSQIPFLGNVIPFLADSANFMYRVGCVVPQVKVHLQTRNMN
jgi:hypothetical protein